VLTLHGSAQARENSSRIGILKKRFINATITFDT
jgi:hypothetical protein